MEFNDKLEAFIVLVNQILLNSKGSLEADIAQAAKECDISHCLNWINYAGRHTDGTYRVQMDKCNITTRWPQWGYEVALKAIVNDKMVLAVEDSTEEPRKLVLALLLRQIRSGETRC